MNITLSIEQEISIKLIDNYNTDGPIFKSPFTVNVVWIPKKKFPFNGGTGYIIVLTGGRCSALQKRYVPFIGHILYFLPNPNYYAILSAYKPAELII